MDGQHRISLLDPHHMQPDALTTSGQVADTYLLALAAGASLATFDTKLGTAAVPSGAQHLLQIP